jgi:hypothetical protein
MKTKLEIFGIPLAQVMSFVSFLIGIITIWIHLEVRIAEIDVEIVNLKQDMNAHKADNRKDFETLHNDMNSGMREISGKIDEIQIYLRRQ